MVDGRNLMPNPQKNRYTEKLLKVFILEHVCFNDFTSHYFLSRILVNVHNSCSLTFQLSQMNDTFWIVTCL